MKKRIFIILIILMIISIINNYNALVLSSSFDNYYLKVLIWYLFGFLILYIISKVNLNFIFNNIKYFYLFGNFLLLLTLFIGSSINGSRAWIDFGLFSFQPSEFMKIFLILIYYKLLNDDLSNFKFFIYSTICFFIPSILTFLEPDTGAIIIYFSIYLCSLFLKGYSKRFYYLISLIIIAFLCSFIFLYYNNQELFITLFGTSFFYRMDRITSFINSDGYQIKNALRNISSAGFCGIDNIVYFPEGTTDFAFTLFITKYGFLGLLFLIIIYFILFFNLLKVNHNKYLKYLVIVSIVIPYFINIFMNIGLFPIIGLTLPFLSYGGSSLISYFILIGLVLYSNNFYINDSRGMDYNLLHHSSYSHM